MFVCEVCDGEEYHDEDGHFYCNTCGTQSQEYIVEQSQEINTYEDGPVHRGLTLRKKRKRKKAQIVVGKPWVIHEALQYLLKAQVEALIGMGYNPKLKEVVGQLWFSFLQKKKVAFCDEEPATISLNCREQTGRHANIGKLPPCMKRKKQLLFDDDATDDLEEDNQPIKTQDEDEQPMKSEDGQNDETIKTEHAFYQPIIDKDSDITRKEKDDDELETMDTDLYDDERQENESVYDSSSTSSSSSSSKSDSDDAKSVGSVGSLGSIKVKRKSKPKKCLEFQQLHTLCFCYIGLIYLEEPVLANDMVRWAREGSLPYHKANEVLPPEMKYSHQDNKILHSQRNPTLHHFQKMSHQIVQYLRVKIEFTEEMLKIACASVLLDLGFSQSIWLLVERIIKTSCWTFDLQKRNPKMFSMEKLKPTDAYVGAFIIVAVKLVYYLDDEREFNDIIRQSLLSKMNIPHIATTWIQWAKQCYEKKSAHRTSGLPKTRQDLKYIKDFEQYVLYCNREIFGNFEHRGATLMYRRGINKTESAFNSNAKERYYNMFSKIASELNPEFDDDENDSVATTCFPWSVAPSGHIINVVQPVVEESKKTECANSCRSNDEIDGGYLASTSTTSVKTRLNSYHFLVEVVSERLNVPIKSLEKCVDMLEEKLFDKRFVQDSLKMN